MKNSSTTALLLVDDDPIYYQVLAQVAAQEGIDLDWIGDPMHLQDVRSLPHYDGILLDYYMGQVTGPDIADHLMSLAGDLPIMLVTVGNCQETHQESWPGCIVNYISKSEGPREVLRKAKSFIDAHLASRDLLLKTTLLPATMKTSTPTQRN